MGEVVCILHRDKSNGPWTRLRQYNQHNLPGPEIYETFEIGEPIHIADSQNIRHGQRHDAIWWIEGFEEWRGKAIVVVNTRGNGERGEFPASAIQKLPAMLRIAIEAV
jgi:hypothetical protein